MKINYRLLFIIFILVAGISSLLLPNRNQILSDGKITQTKPVNLDNISTSPQTVSGQPRVEISTSKGNFSLDFIPDHPDFSRIMAKLSTDFYRGQSVSVFLAETVTSGLARITSGQTIVNAFLPDDKILSTDILTK